jgi:hypothetical protein
MSTKDSSRFWIPNERKFVLSRDVLTKPEVVWNSRNDIKQKRKHVSHMPCSSTWKKEVLQTYKSDDGSTVSIPGGSNVSNLEINVQDNKIIREKKQPNSINNGEFICLLNDSQGGHYLSPMSYTEAMQSYEQKQWFKSDERRISFSEGK